MTSVDAHRPDGGGAPGLRPDFPPWEPRSAWRVPLVLGIVAAYAMLLGARHTPRSLVAFSAPWTALVYLGLPLAAILLLDARGRAARASAWALAGLLVAGSAARSWIEPLNDLAKAHAGVLTVFFAAFVALGLLTARRGGVNLGRWGLGAGDWRWWGRWTALLVGGALLFVVLGAVADPSLREYYPDNEAVRDDAGLLWLYVASYGLYFIGWEFLFRGFLLFGFARVAGPLVAVLLQALPFFLMHRGGPESEMVASFVGGVLLAAFCYRARSYWPAVILHWALNAPMNVIGFYW